MSAPAPLVAPAAHRAGTGLDHLYCCDPDIALCGADISDTPELPDDAEITCVVCSDLETAPCLICGTPA